MTLATRNAYTETQRRRTSKFFARPRGSLCGQMAPKSLPPRPRKFFRALKLRRTSNCNNFVLYNPLEKFQACMSTTEAVVNIRLHGKAGYTIINKTKPDPCCSVINLVSLLSSSP